MPSERKVSSCVELWHETHLGESPVNVRYPGNFGNSPPELGENPKSNGASLRPFGAKATLVALLCCRYFQSEPRLLP